MGKCIVFYVQFGYHQRVMHSFVLVPGFAFFRLLAFGKSAPPPPFGLKHTATQQIFLGTVGVCGNNSPEVGRTVVVKGRAKDGGGVRCSSLRIVWVTWWDVCGWGLHGGLFFTNE